MGIAGQAAPAETPTLKQIMADPAWVARSPDRACWSWDGSSVLFDRRRDESRLTDRWQVGLDGGEPALISDQELPFVSSAGGAHNADRSMKVFSRSGDVFLRDMSTGTLTQITRTLAGEQGPMFMADGSIAFRRDGVWIIRGSAPVLERQAADIRIEDDPDDEEEEDRNYLEAQQHRLFEIVRRRKSREEQREDRDETRRDADSTRVPGPFFLGEDWRIHHRALSPTGRWLLLSVSKDPGEEKRDHMPAYVNEDGYVSTSDVRPKVGENERRDDRLVLLDLELEAVHWLDATGLPMIDDDPLAWLREQTGADGEDDPEKADAAADVESGDDETGPGEGEDTIEADENDTDRRPFTVQRIDWSRGGERVALMMRSNDNKDRWIAVVNLSVDEGADEPTLAPVHHLRDEAWINWRYNEMGWTRDGSALWYLSEHTGFGHLYLWEAETGESRALTSGRFTVQDVAESPTGGELYFRANRLHPGLYELERIGLSTGRAGAITGMGGTVESFHLSPSGEHVLLRCSSAMDPPELFVQDNRPGAVPTRLTHTDTELFRSFDWIEPDFVEVPSSHGDDPIYCRVYQDPTVPAPTDRGKPVVLFSHGSGYTQHVYNGWSYYFREHMFHTLLCQLGYIVIAPDFRASAGYGRDWRTAIYRRMGTPELEDFDDCLAWLGEHTDADLDNVGIYGGSYGGFMSLMAMFLRPGVYDCGAALRPVTDWAHYNHGYTSNILNTPELDPEAFERSSPIEHAEGLEGALLMCHGMLDDNVVAQDTIRLAQRLIELEKEDWEMALYPIEPHGFREPTGWLDEYRRILKLFETHLKPG
ncbi:MAG: prolyl oligopeptidase family serine peptidase [Phycisphaerales bacterium]|nr:prolyl oligopeptidase family serine peptidase [Phycisphaerales bacterium]